MPPMHLRSAVHGHEVVFLQPSPTANIANAAADVTWTADSIAVSADSPLNGPARVLLRVPISTGRAGRAWCERRGVNWRAGGDEGLVFDVDGFSRYRYVESDDDDDKDDDEEQKEEDNEEAAAVEVAEMADGEGKVKGKGKGTGKKAQGGRRDRDERSNVAEGGGRPRLSMPKALLVDDAMQVDAEREEADEEDFEAAAAALVASRPEPPLWAGSFAVQTPAMIHMRDALFEHLPAYGRARPPLKSVYARDDHHHHDGEAPWGRPDPDDVRMEDVAGGVEDVWAAARAATDPEDLAWWREGEAYGAEPDRPRAAAQFPESSLPFPTVDDSVAAGKEGVRVDAGLMLGRVTRVCFGGNGGTARAFYGVGGSDAFGIPGHMVEVGTVYGGGLEREFVARVLRVHCTAWHAAVAAAEGEEEEEEEEEDIADVRVPGLGSAFLHDEVTDFTLEQVVEELRVCYEAGDENARHAQVAFWLLLALYRKEEGAGRGLLRRVAAWGRGEAGSAFEDETNRSGGGARAGLRVALLELTLGRVEEAVKAAADSGHLRLALLIARGMEGVKEDLRADADAQLAAYGLLKGILVEGEQVEQDWDAILTECASNAEVSVDERMILLVLGGHVAPVARFLGLSWYRLFTMELLHGAGSSDLTQAERVSAAVAAVASSRLSTQAPHGCAGYQDVVYHLLRLYADPTASYPLTSGVYANASFGTAYCPLDARFAWLLYQVLTAVIPQAATPRAPLKLADEFATQLRAGGMHLWAFYVLCSGGAGGDVLRAALVKDWPNIANDFVEWSAEGVDNDVGMQMSPGAGAGDGGGGGAARPAHSAAEPFLTDVLGTPREWIAEAKAVAAHVDGDHLAECRHWIASATEVGAATAHDLLASHVFPGMVAAKSTAQLPAVADLLQQLDGSEHVPSWSARGGLILDYLTHVAGVPALQRATPALYHGMVARVQALAAAATTPEQRHAATVIADGVATAQRAQLFDVAEADRDAVLRQVVEDLEVLSCSRGVSLRVAGEYKIEAEHGRKVALRFSAAFPAYIKFFEAGRASGG